MGSLSPEMQGVVDGAAAAHEQYKPPFEERKAMKHITGSALGDGERQFFLQALIKKRTECKECIDLVTRLKFNYL